MKKYIPNRRSFLQRSLAFLAGLTVTPLLGKSPAPQMLNEPNIDIGEPFLGEISIFAGNFAPRNWAFCQGQLLPIAQNTALFTLLGTAYGGNGIQTFGLPDLRGRIAIGVDSNYTQGQRSGAETTTLTAANITGLSVATGKVKIRTTGTQGSGVTDGASDGTSNAVLAKGSGQAMNNMPPYSVMNYIICLSGVFPSRN